LSHSSSPRATSFRIVISADTSWRSFSQGSDTIGFIFRETAGCKEVV
jgi:hypothetical protein